MRQHSSACLMRSSLAAAVIALYGSTHAATIIVNSTVDPGDAGTCTLRQAIVSMNTGAVTGNCVNTGSAFGAGDTINFADSLFTSGTPTIDTGSELLVTHGSYATNLSMDAGAGRNVVVERAMGAAALFSVIHSRMSGGLQLSGLTVRNGVANNQYGRTKYGTQLGGIPLSLGGGVLSESGELTLDRCVIANNLAGEGAGVGAVKVVLNSTLVSGNMARAKSAFGRLGWGGGVWSKSDLTINNSTISDNYSYGPRGGAVGSFFGPVTVSNSTISGNNAPIGFGGIATMVLPTPISLLNSTIACNESSPVDEAIYVKGLESGGSVNAISTILADTSNSLCTTHTRGEIYIGAFTAPAVITGDHNLVVTTSYSAPFAATPTIGDPLLGPLQNYGGPTPTHALAANSPAIDAGSNPAGFAYDQRGAPFSRFVGKAPDIGAYESVMSHLCGSDWGKSFVNLSSSSPNLCSSGAYLQNGQVFGSGPWSWFCAANAAPHPNEFCGAQVQANVSLVIDNASGTPISGAIYGQPLHLKAVVADGRSPAQTTPTGAVSFFDATGGGFVPVCVGSALSSGEAVCDTTNAPIDTGARQVEAVYNGDGTFGTATSSPGSIQINPAASTTVIVSQTPDPVYTESPFTVVAQVNANAPSVTAPTGAVQITDQTDNLSCTYDLAQTTPGCALRPVSSGTHALLVAYLGNGNVAASSTTGTQQAVVPADRIFADGFGI